MKWLFGNSNTARHAQSKQPATVDSIRNKLASYQAKEGIDLTVMGAYSHHRIRDVLLGSFTAKMLSKTQKPLLLLR